MLKPPQSGKRLAYIESWRIQCSAHAEQAPFHLAPCLHTALLQHPVLVMITLLFLSAGPHAAPVHAHDHQDRAQRWYLQA